MPDRDDCIRGSLPTILIQMELQRITLDLYGVEFRLASLQDSVKLAPDAFDLHGGRVIETREVNLWLAVERARASLDDGVIERLKWASRLPVNYPAKTPRDRVPLGIEIETGENSRPRRKPRTRP